MPKTSSLSGLAGLAFVLSGVALSGCQVVKVKQQPLSVFLSNERESILVRSRLSEATLSVLASTGQEAEECSNDPAVCLTKLRKVPQVVDEQYLSVGSELYLAKVNQLKDTPECHSPFEPEPFNTQLSGLGNKIVRPVNTPAEIDLKPYYNCLSIQQDLLANSLRHAYAYLFYTEREPSQRLFDNRQVQVRDFYNQALVNLITLINQTNKNYRFTTNKPYGAEKLAASGYDFASTSIFSYSYGL